VAYVTELAWLCIAIFFIGAFWTQHAILKFGTEVKMREPTAYQKLRQMTGRIGFTLITMHDAETQLTDPVLIARAKRLRRIQITLFALAPLIGLLMLYLGFAPKGA
jgi:hypothetical protein